MSFSNKVREKNLLEFVDEKIHRVIKQMKADIR